MMSAVKTKRLRMLRFLGLLSLLLSLSSFFFSFAQTAQDAINLATEHPAFAKALADRPNWSANAYDTKNRYGIWRVEFFDEGGNGLGWADVNLEQQRVYSWDTSFDITENQYAEAEQILMDFLRQDQLANELVGSVDDSYNYWVGYDGWRECWTVHIDRGVDSLDLIVRSRRSEPRSLDHLYLERVNIINIMSYGDWQNANSANVVAVAFEHPDIAAAVRDVDGWTTQTEKLEGEAWKVRFLSGETIVAEADVNMADGSLANIAIP